MFINLGRIPDPIVALSLSFMIIATPHMLVAQDVTHRPTVTVSAVEENEMIGRVPISGTLIACNEALIYPQVSGYTIDALYYDIGDQVERGDVLARVNSQTLQALLSQADAELNRAIAGVTQAESQIASAQAAVTQTGSALDRAEQLSTSGVGSQAVLDQAIAGEQTARASLASANSGLGVARAQVQQAQAQLDIAQLNLGYAEILAPVDGLISTRNGRLGAMASSGGDPIFRLIADGCIEVEAEIVETAISGIRQDNEVLLDIAGIGAVPGQVRLISPTVNPVTRLGTIHITTAENPALREGLFASGWITVARRVTLTVPATAVLTDARGAYALRVNGDVIERQEITTGLIWQDMREVVLGLELGDVVVTRAGAFFSDGDIINPVSADAGATE